MENDDNNCSIKEDDDNVIHGPESPIPLSQNTIGRHLYIPLVDAAPDSIAMIDAFTGEKLLHSELLQKAVNLAEALKYYNYNGQGVNLAISSENNIQFFIPILASLFNCSVTVPLNHIYTLYELEHTLDISKPKVVFCSQVLAEKFINLKSNKLFYIERIIIIDRSEPIDSDIPGEVETMDEFIKSALKGTDVNVRKFQPVDLDSSKTTAFIMCSSGTTGLPKGARLSHLNFMVRLTHARDPLYHSQNKEDKLLGILPFYHCYGMIISFGAISNLQTIITLKRFNEDVFLKSIQDYKIHTMALAPPLVIFLAKTDKINKYDLSSVEDILCGAAPLSKAVEDAVHSRLKCNKIRQGFGMTETTLAVTLTNIGDYRVGSCGKILSFVSCKIRDPETGRSQGPNKVGELCFKGPLLMLGYYNNEEATKNTFTSDGWLKTGDLGYFDDDGYIYIIDRLKELIKYKGFQVAPAELENILINHPKVGDAGVVGLPDDEAGEKPLAFIVKKPNVEITAEEIQKYVADLVSPQKRLTGGVIFVDVIPKNPSGKILRKELRKMLQDLKVKNGQIE